MKYKRSIYNIEIDKLEDGSILLYNTNSGFFGIMDTKTQVAFYDIEHIDVDSIEDEELKKNVNILIQYRYIINEEQDELAAFLLERGNARFNRSSLNLTIAPTLACNMRCPYCYENKTNKFMSKETQVKLLEFVKHHFTVYPTIKQLNITWYGGEPLLQKQTIYDLTESFLEICKEHDCGYSASIVTNGALLDKDTAWKLSNECHVKSAQITIDGMPELHNQRRIFVDGSGSFDLIIKNIDECKDFMIISIRMNVDKTNEDQVDQFLKYAVEEMKWVDNPRVYIAPVDCYTESCAHTESSCFDRSKFAEIQRDFQNKNYEINRERVVKQFFPSKSLIHCNAEQQNNYVVDPEGYLYTCWMLIGNEKHRSGHISQPFVTTTEYYKWLSSELPEKCKECQYLPLCAGGCGYFRVTQQGEPNCTSSYYSYKDTLRLAYRDYIKQKNFGVYEYEKK